MDKTLKTLHQLISSLQAEIHGKTDAHIGELTYDSRTANKDSLFFAVRGTVHDGHTFIEQVIDKGCKAIICESLPEILHDHVCYIKTNSTTKAMGHVAAQFYDNPSEKLKVVAVTGTNGKTTVATLLFNLFRSMGHTCGLLSTVQNQINETIIPSTHTTPDAIRLQQMLNHMVNEKCEYAFMEASSHAIDQNRIAGIHFTGVLFTNITHDHLDYHKTFDNYLHAKKRLFDEVNNDAFALTNRDDRNGNIMLQNCKATRYTYGIKQMADFKARICESDLTGMLLDIDGQEAWFRLVGHFNAYNLLCVYGAAFLLGKEKHDIIKHLSALPAVNGRFEYIRSSTGIVAIIDYAHTPDALKNVLDTINEIRTKNEQLITVVGCGGNRDAAKRPLMADIATELSTRVIFTSDNPRNEKPEDIIAQMQKGVKPLHYKKTLSITDRKEAIKTAVSLANKGDILLIAGKGHETYQELNGVKYPFDDKEIVKEMFQLMHE